VCFSVNLTLWEILHIYFSFTPITLISTQRKITLLKLMADVQDLQSIHIKESIILIFFIMDDEKNNQHYSDDTSWSYIVCVCVLIHCRGVAYCYSTEAGGMAAG
jgi:hypothetical protein